MKRFNRWGVFAVALLTLSYPILKTYKTHHQYLPVFSLLIPGGAENEISTRLWLKAAEEVGVPLQTISYDDFTNPFQGEGARPMGILLPDEVSKSASPTLISYLRHYVNRGGKLILVGDALMHDLNGSLKEAIPSEAYFQFPKLLGRVGDTIQLKRDTVRITDIWRKKLKIPPGQVSPKETIPAAFREFCTYQSLHAHYPHWKTEASFFSGETILKSGDGSLIAGIQKQGKGEVLWINLPLSYLKRRTDGLLMHSFLAWISEDWLGLPRLLSVPNGVGGMVLNIHVDSNAAMAYLNQLKEQNFFSDGPFSIHVTAGPDTRHFNDGLGFNLDRNAISQEWVRYWIAKGHEVGAHGGWIHDYFGLQIGEKKNPEFIKFLEKNFESVKKVSGKSPVVYSAPLGNHPIWVNQWLRKYGYHSYYFVGDNGMAPTQNFRDLEFTDKDLWSFPVASFLRVASFEEAEEQKIPTAEMTTWLTSLSHYVSDEQSIRLFYFHPPGIRFYQNTLNSWMKENAKLAAKGKFKWYTMDALSKFLTIRSEVKWSIKALGENQQYELSAHGHSNLKEMHWRIPKEQITDLHVTKGKVKIFESENGYQIQPENNENFSIVYSRVAHEI